MHSLVLALALAAPVVTAHVWAAPVKAENAANRKTAAKPKLRKTADQAVQPGEFANFGQWQEVAAFIDDMVERHGFDRKALEILFREARYVDSAIQLVKPAPPGRPKNWRAYRARFIEPMRIQAGADFWQTHAQALERAEQMYGVPAEIIVGIIGVETVYGRNTGNFRVLDTLTTLGFDYPDTPNRTARMKFFRGQLEQTLLLSRESAIDPFTLLGSYAGAIGLPQFMPGSIRNFAVDFDGDGKIDLRNSQVDAIGSVANFLVQHGWQSGQPIAFPATVTTTSMNGNPDNRWEAYIGQGLEAKYTLAEMATAGIAANGEAPADLPYGLVDLQNGSEATEYWLGAANFFAITKYNRSFFYAMSVVELGRAVRTARGG
ncbi:lytic murein transglycosylase B [Noviherbaspirillum sedimenti]|uniref:Lytic murein transglycosylase B n=1 Tax=Noviherbaspirillum sedimenti TaxID=2320865 RepID=A0A3A3G881_9BURK|nr:lytic murein transglycosylase B [Noviherbaspirillum sedimenti]RJG04618.1 lytic murein transglycosylase B [Noviherbaspirillum sedimenti]